MNKVSLALLFLLVAAPAWASHPEVLVNLTQRNSDATALAMGGIAKTPTVQITASSSAATCESASLTYRLELELKPLGTPFTGVPTHQSAAMAKPDCLEQPYPFITVSNLASGSYHWQVREWTQNSGTGVWTAFNGGAVAFQVRQGLSASPNTLAFGPQRVGTSAMQLVQLTNGSTSNVTVTALNVTGAAYAVSGQPLPFSLAPNASASVTVTFAPTAQGAASGSLSVVSNDPLSPTVVTLSGTGVQSTAVLSVNSLSFGNQRVGTNSATRPVTITNTGNATLNISALTVSPQYSVTGLTAPATLSAGGSLTFTVRFSPTAMGAAPGTVSIVSDAATSPSTVALSGTGIAPVISLSPTSINFGNQRAGTSSAPTTVTLANTGTDTLTVSALSTSAPFTVSGLTLPATIGAGGSATFRVTYNPTVTGPSSGAVTITSDVPPGPPATLALTGNGTMSAIAVSPTSVAFGSQRVGAQTPPSTITITNPGTDALTIESLLLNGPFTLAGLALPATVPPGGSITAQLSFQPTAAGAASGGFTLVSDAPTSPTTVTMDGMGIQGALSISPASLAFGDERVGTTTLPRNVALVNNGTDVMVIQSVTVAGPFILIPPTLPATLAPGQGLTLELAFAPRTTGNAAGSLLVQGDGAPRSASVTLTGNGTISQAVLAPSTLNFQRVLVGSASAGAQVTLTNTGTTSLNLDGFGVSGPYEVSGLNGQATLAPGASTQFTVTFNPTLPGAANGGLELFSDDPAAPAQLRLQGIGVAPRINAAPNAVAFGQVALGTASSTTVRLSNQGDATLNISGLTLSGANAADFALDAGAGAMSLAPGAETIINVGFAPSGHGARAATLEVASDAFGAATLSVALSGTGVGSRVAVTPAAMDFGDANVGSGVVAQAIQILNAGETNLVVSAITFSGVDASDFIVTTALPITVTPNSSAQVELAFQPSAIGARSARATVISNDVQSSNVSLVLTGNGTSRTLALTPAAVAFGNVRAGRTASRDVTLTNSGSVALTVSNLSFSGDDAALFTRGSVALPLSLAPGASQTVSVTFSPTRLGNATAALTVMSDDPAQANIVVPMTGRGVSPSVALMPGSLEFGGQLVGKASAERTAELKNTGTSPLTVTTVAFAGPNAASFSLVNAPATPFTLAPGESRSLQVKLTAGAIADQEAVLNVVSDDSTAPQAQVKLGGVGLSTLLAVSPTHLDFGANKLPVVDSATKTLTLINLSGDALVLNDAVLSGANASDFLFTPVAGTLQPGRSMTVRVNYRTAAAANSTATMSFGARDPAVPAATVTLSGKAVSKLFAVTPESLDFGAVTAGQSSSPLTVVLSNLGDQAVSVASIQAADPRFVIEGNVTQLAPGANASFTVTFKPTASGEASSNAAITLTGASGAEATVALKGTGLAVVEESGCGCSDTGAGSSLLALLAVVFASRLARRRQGEGRA
ncbi:MAG TPA: choice-of-anchor D domain-containing protein [Myxococcaceae bacterium]|nr:choice-of-anchor D domain-containing protein [Myxococcaceae bacterium]